MATRLLNINKAFITASKTSNITMGIIAGVITALFSIPVMIAVTNKLSVKYWIAIPIILLIGAVIQLSSKRDEICLAAFAFFIPLAQIDQWFFFSPAFKTGAPGIQISLPDILLIVLYFNWFLRIALSKKEKISAPKALFPALVFLFSVLVAITSAMQKTIAFLDFVQLAKMFLIFYWLAFNIRTKRDLKILTLAVIASVIFNASFAFAQKITGGSLGLRILGESVKPEQISGETVSRLSGLMVHPTTFGTFLASMFGYCFLTLTQSRKKYISWLSGVAIVMGFIALVFTLARGAIVAWIIALIITIVIGFKYQLFDNERAKKLIGITIIVFIVAGLAFSVLLFQRFIASDPGNVQGRYNLAFAAIEMIKYKPLTGVGPGNFVYAMPVYDYTGMWHMYPYPVHNHFLLVASETGLIGLATFLALLVAIIKLSISSIRNAQDKVLKGAALAGFSALIVMVVTGLSSEHNIIPPQQHLLWFHLGMIVGIERLINFEKRNTKIRPIAA